MMIGNWTQHCFVCPQNPRCDYRLAYTVINHPDNQKSYNDGQGLTLAHFLAQRKRFLWDRGYLGVVQGLFRRCSRAVRGY